MDMLLSDSSPNNALCTEDEDDFYFEMLNDFFSDESSAEEVFSKYTYPSIFEHRIMSVSQHL